VVELVAKKTVGFNMALHTKCWKFYEARPRGNDRNFKGEYVGFVEGFERYLYSNQWVSFLIRKLKDQEKLHLVTFNKLLHADSIQLSPFCFLVSHLVMILIWQGYGLEKVSLLLSTEKYIPSEQKTDTIIQDMNITKMV